MIKRSEQKKDGDFFERIFYRKNPFFNENISSSIKQIIGEQSQTTFKDTLNLNLKILN